uniref:EF-hand domain-containing protein n=1 Tax=Mesocestoides corti TaxID=53468 RepID=A0A5K3FLZ7_MESCO
MIHIFGRKTSSKKENEGKIEAFNPTKWNLRVRFANISSKFSRFLQKFCISTLQGTALTQVVTPNQMARIFSFLKLDVTWEECQRLSRKFADAATDLVNYAALCQAIDPFCKIAKRVKCYADADPQPQPPPRIGEFPKPRDRANWDALSTPKALSVGDNVPADVLMSRIRHLVLVNRIQLKKYFEDFDNLRSGRVSRSQFERALSVAGITRVGMHDLTPAQVETLANAYAWTPDPSRVNWRRFVGDVDAVFTAPEIEQNPLCQVVPSATFVAPKPGTGDWDSATEEMKDRCGCAMRHLRRNITERRVDMKPEFQAFDKINRGHVKVHNFKQIISSLRFHLPDDQLDAVIAKYADDYGFNYRRFLNDIDPPAEESLHYEYPKRIKRLREAFNEQQKPHESEPVVRDVVGVMDYIKREVFHQRIRLSEWFRDYDPLRHGKISRQQFRRAMNLLPIPLKETEFNCIEHYYKADDPNDVRWKDFCDEIELIFSTPLLEKDPLKQPDVYQSESAVSRNHLPTEVAEAADRAIKKIGNRARSKRTQLTQWFNDYDKTHRMTLSQNQFRRVLHNLGLAEDISKHEWDALYARYRHPVGLIDDVDYLAFADDVFRLAGMAYRVP